MNSCDVLFMSSCMFAIILVNILVKTQEDNVFPPFKMMFCGFQTNKRSDRYEWKYSTLKCMLL